MCGRFGCAFTAETKKGQYVYYQMLLRSKLDRVSEDRLSDAISDELWTMKSAELQEELRRVRGEMERHEGASQAYETAGLQILELAQSAYSSYGQNWRLARRTGRFPQLAHP
jgi:hypothetical protein